MTYSNKNFWTGIKINYMSSRWKFNFTKNCGIKGSLWPSLWVSTPFFTFGFVKKNNPIF